MAGSSRLAKRHTLVSSGVLKANKNEKETTMILRCGHVAEKSLSPRTTRLDFLFIHFRRKKRGNDDDGDEPPSAPSFRAPWDLTLAALPSWTGLCFKTLLGMTVALYILNQKHMLPKPLAAIVSKTLFWPTLPITYSLRIGKWSTVIDDTVLMGGCPFGWASMPERLYDEYGVRC